MKSLAGNQGKVWTQTLPFQSREDVSRVPELEKQPMQSTAEIGLFIGRSLEKTEPSLE
jgi:hypothetical protein